MEFYINVLNNRIENASNYKLDGYVNVPVSEDMYYSFLRDELAYIYVDGAIVENPGRAEEIAKQEKERISHLTCTKRVLALCLQEYGVKYAQLKELIATNEQAQLEWDLCVELERNNPLLDIMGAKLNVTPEQIDNIFKFANGEVTELPKNI